jgi:hypothetical protein
MRGNRLAGAAARGTCSANKKQINKTKREHKKIPGKRNNFEYNPLKKRPGLMAGESHMS